MVQLEKSWLTVLKDEFEKDYMKRLKNFLLSEKENGQIIYPPSDQIFAALDFTPFDKVKVVVIGQDPYHGASQAHGLSFSVNKGIDIPPSLRNIYKELVSDVGITMPSHGFLKHWADQGVLLLNATLTVRANEAGSHQKKGWENFTDEIIRQLSSRRKDLVFLLWVILPKVKKRSLMVIKFWKLPTLLLFQHTMDSLIVNTFLKPMPSLLKKG